MCIALTESRITTAEELLHARDDSLRRELVRGELLEMSPAGSEHGRISLVVGGMLLSHIRQTESGVAFGAETGFLLSRNPDTVRAPDAAFVSRRRAEAVGRTAKFWPGAPDLAVEVLSPSDSFHYVQEKALEWVAAGTIAVLVLDPDERTAIVYRPGGDAHVYRGEEEVDLSDAVPGFGASVAAMFA